MEHSKLTLQINNLEALERLIGGDAKVEFDIRQSVVEAFTKKHLKTIANEDLMKNTLEALKTEMNKAFLTEITVGDGWNKRVSYALNDRARELFSSHLKYGIDEAMQTFVADHVGLNDLAKKVNEIVNRKAEDIAAVVSEAIISRRIDKLVDERIKQKLNLQ